MILYDHLMVISFTLLYPVYDYYHSKKFRKRILSDIPGIRIRAYKIGLVWIWLISLFALIIWIYNERSFIKIGLDFSSALQVIISIILLIAALFYISYAYRNIKNNQKLKDDTFSKLKSDSASIYLPHNTKDFKWFVLLAISVGICEELLFRGYLIWYLKEFTSLVPAVIISSVLFGFAHSYQGWKGIIQSGIFGLFIALFYLFADSLIIPIAFHIAGDIYSGMLGWAAFEEANQIENE